MRYRVTHTTSYQYGYDVTTSHNLAHLVPRTNAYQKVLDNNFQITPAPAMQTHQRDAFDNIITLFTVSAAHRELIIDVRTEVEVRSKPYPQAADTPPWEHVRDHLLKDFDPKSLWAYEFVFDSMYVKTSADLWSYAVESFPPGRPILEAVFDLTRRIHSDFAYDPSATSVSTPLEEVVRHRRGVCQDFAHLQIGCLRSMGLPARYVSGYLRTLPSPGQPRLVGCDASHAWVAVYVPGSGWLDFDPTNDSTPDESHITVAVGRDYNDVSPIRGIVVGGGGSSIAVSVDVEPLEADVVAPLSAGGS